MRLMTEVVLTSDRTVEEKLAWLDENRPTRDNILRALIKQIDDLRARVRELEANR